jgi:hypothetical protein
VNGEQKLTEGTGSLRGDQRPQRPGGPLAAEDPLHRRAGPGELLRREQAPYLHGRPGFDEGTTGCGSPRGSW